MSIFGDNPLGDVNISTESGTAPAADVAATAPETPVVSPEVDAGTPAAAESVETPLPNYFNTDDFKDHLVKLKVGGEDVEMPLGEALAGAMRGADYTRKTQELSEARRRLHQADALAAALDADPAGTLRQIAEAYDLDSSGLQPVQRDPDEQALVNRDRQLAQREAALTRQRINMELQALILEYGDFDPTPVAEFAYQNGVDLTTAYKVMNYENMRKAQQEQARQSVAQAAARDAQVVHSQGASQRGVATPGPQKIDSIRDAWRVAEQQLKLS